MKNVRILQLFFVLVISILVGFACSSDSGSTGPGTTYSYIKFADFKEITEEIAPIPYVTSSLTQISLMPNEIDSLWYVGSESILNKVLGEDHPTSLFSYLDQFDNIISEIEDLLRVDDSGNLFADTSWMKLYELSSPTTIPSQAQAVIGTSVDLDQYIDAEFEDDPDGVINHIGFTRNDQEEVVLLYTYWPQGTYGFDEESFLYYARLDLSDSSIVVKSVNFKDDGQGNIASHLLDIHSVNESDFAYRMTWFANSLPAPDSTMLGCIVGGGNRDSEFALKYRQKQPAHAAEYDTNYASEQVFNYDYSESTSLISSYDQFVSESLIIPYSAVPTSHLPSPWQD